MWDGNQKKISGKSEAELLFLFVCFFTHGRGCKAACLTMQCRCRKAGHCGMSCEYSKHSHCENKDLSTATKQEGLMIIKIYKYYFRDSWLKNHVQMAILKLMTLANGELHLKSSCYFMPIFTSRTLHPWSRHWMCKRWILKWQHTFYI